MDRTARRILACGTFILFLSLPSPAALASKKDFPNVLLITIDTLRPDRLSCYGSSRLQTPNIDGVVRGGALFSRAFSHNPITLAAHVNILLGQTTPPHG